MFNNQKLYIVITRNFLCFVWISEQPANFALHSIKRSIFITEVGSVYSVVRTESLYDTYMLVFKNLISKDLAIGLKIRDTSSS